MFRRSRLAIFAFSLFFLQAGLLDAYVRCLEASWSSVGDRSERPKSIQNSVSDDEVSHCAEDWSAHRTIASPHLLKKDVRTDWAQPISFVAADHINLPGHSGRPFVLLLSQFLYPSIAVYQAKVVYRI